MNKKFSSSILDFELSLDRVHQDLKACLWGGGLVFLRQKNKAEFSYKTQKAQYDFFRSFKYKEQKNLLTHSKGPIDSITVGRKKYDRNK